MKGMKIAYITSQTPYGKGEQFILPEILEVIKKGHDVVVIPVRPEKEIALGDEPKEVAKFTMHIPLLSLNLILKSFLIFIKHPLRVVEIIFKILRHSGSLGKILKNLLIIPKGLVVSEILKKRKINHIHAHWASTPSTLAYIASELTGIPWSFTAHRWDIAENNMLREKRKTAKFIRVISKSGYNKILEIIGDKYKDKCVVLHMGVSINKFSDKKEKSSEKDKDSFVIGTPANLVEVKGHKYLIEAIKILVQKGYSIKCYFFGNGPLREELEKNVDKMNLKDIIIFEGNVPHDKLLKLYADNEVDCVVLPSIVTDKGEHEGIPVSLIEAMAHKIPVISTNTGGIPELLEGGAGIIVAQKNSDELAKAIMKLMNDEKLREELGEKGFEKVKKEFNLSKIVEELLYLMDTN
jgi:glycosyltransferase involved in cell wall biosynthesis